MIFRISSSCSWSPSSIIQMSNGSISQMILCPTGMNSQASIRPVSIRCRQSGREQSIRNLKRSRACPFGISDRENTRIKVCSKKKPVSRLRSFLPISAILRTPYTTTMLHSTAARRSTRTLVSTISPPTSI